MQEYVASPAVPAPRVVVVVLLLLVVGTNSAEPITGRQDLASGLSDGRRQRCRSGRLVFRPLHVEVLRSSVPG
jgi:hypothetical protein